MRIEQGRAIPETTGMAKALWESFYEIFPGMTSNIDIQDLMNNGVESWRVMALESLEIDDSMALGELAGCPGLFSSLKWLSVDIPQDIYDGGIWETFTLPSGLNACMISNANIEELKVGSTPGLKTLTLMSMPCLKSVRGLDGLRSLKSLTVAGCREAEVDYQALMKSNRGLNLCLDVIGIKDHSAADRLLSDRGCARRVTAVEEINGDTLFRISPQKYFEFRERASGILSKVTSKSMPAHERAAEIHGYAVNNFKYVKTEITGKYSEDDPRYHSAVGTVLQGMAVCEGQSRATAYLMQEAGIEAESIGVVMDKGKRRGGIIKDGLLCNHEIYRMKLGGSWYYMDPTNDDPPARNNDGTSYPAFLCLKDLVDGNHKNLTYRVTPLEARHGNAMHSISRQDQRQWLESAEKKLKLLGKSGRRQPRLAFAGESRETIRENIKKNNPKLGKLQINRETLRPELSVRQIAYRPLPAAGIIRESQEEMQEVGIGMNTDIGINSIGMNGKGTGRDIEASWNERVESVENRNKGMSSYSFDDIDDMSSQYNQYNPYSLCDLYAPYSSYDINSRTDNLDVMTAEAIWDSRENDRCGFPGRDQEREAIID